MKSSIRAWRSIPLLGGAASLAFLGLLLAEVSVFAKEADPSCLSRSLATVLTRIRGYGQEVWRTRGMRIFLKDLSPAEAERSLLEGFFRSPEPAGSSGRIVTAFRNTIHFVPKTLSRALVGKPYEFTPFQGVNHLLVRAPIAKVSKLLGRPKQPTLLTDMVIGAVAYGAADKYFQRRVKEKFDENLKQEAAMYDLLIESDYRFDSIRDALAANRISREAARQEAYLLYLAYSEYFKYMQEQVDRDGPQVSKEKLLNHHLFVHLREVIQNGVPETEGYVRVRPGPAKPTPEQAEDLFRVNHLLYLKYAIIPELLKGSELLREMRANPAIASVIKSIEEDPFAKFLIVQRREGRITEAELQRYLGEDAHWQAELQQLDVIGLAKLKIVDGHYSREPLTISDIRGEIEAEILGKTARREP